MWSFLKQGLSVWIAGYPRMNRLLIPSLPLDYSTYQIQTLSKLEKLARGDITRIMDPNLHGDYNYCSIWRALELAMLCANPSSENRPSMSLVVIELKECLTSENSMKGKNQDIDSHSSFEMSMSFDTKAVPSAR